jgi:hypothetical protein
MSSKFFGNKAAKQADNKKGGKSKFSNHNKIKKKKKKKHDRG